MRIQVQIYSNSAIPNTDLTWHSPIAGHKQSLIHDQEQDKDMATYSKQSGSHDMNKPMRTWHNEHDNQSAWRHEGKGSKTQTRTMISK